MFIGSKSDSTVFDVFKIGLENLILQMGMPTAVNYKAGDSTMVAKAPDITKRVDLLRITFPLREGATAEAVSTAIATTNIQCRVEEKDGRCTITVPPLRAVR